MHVFGHCIVLFSYHAFECHSSSEISSPRKPTFMSTVTSIINPSEERQLLTQPMSSYKVVQVVHPFFLFFLFSSRRLTFFQLSAYDAGCRSVSLASGSLRKRSKASFSIHTVLHHRRIFDNDTPLGFYGPEAGGVYCITFDYYPTHFPGCLSSLLDVGI